MNKYRVALVGTTGVVGRITRKVLEEKNLPIAEYELFSSSKSAGSKIAFDGREYTVKELSEHSFDNNKFDYAIFTAGGKVSEKYAHLAVQNKCTVIDNSSFYRMNNDVPLIVPEVNFECAKTNKGIIANPNCSTIQAVVALSPLDKKYNIKLEENSEKYIIFKNNIISLSREIVKLINQGIKVHQESKFTNDSKSNMCTNIVNKYIREKYQYNLSIEEMKFLNDNIENMSIN